MTPKEYLNDICKPNVDDVIRDPTSVRRAWVAVVSLLHFADYLAAHRGRIIADVRAELCSGFPNFQLIEDIGNASKHFKRERGRRKGLSATHIGIGPGAAFSDGTYFSDGTSFADADDVVRVEFRREIIDVVHLCRECLTFLMTKA